MRDTDYPYTAKDTGNCSYNESLVFVNVTSYVKLSRVDENYLKDLLCAVGPVSAAVDASSRGFQFYKSGVFNDVNCRKYLNHAMVEAVNEIFKMKMF